MNEVGLVLMDRSQNALALDQGAAIILNCRNEPGVKPDLTSCFPPELTEVIRHLISSDLSSLTRLVHIGKREYFCHVYQVEPQDPCLTEAIVAVHFGKRRAVNSAIDEAAITYRLTARELDALRGVSMGLGNKELAELMNISPNTVKAFLRLIMIKMGVATRTGLVAKILQKQATFDEPLRDAEGRQEARLTA